MDYKDNVRKTCNAEGILKGLFLFFQLLTMLSFHNPYFLSLIDFPFIVKCDWLHKSYRLKSISDSKGIRVTI